MAVRKLGGDTVVDEGQHENEPKELGIAAAIEGLRSELEEAWESSRGKPVRFRVSDVTLTVQTVARREGGVSGKVRWYLIEAGADGRVARESTQTLVLTLTPALFDDETETSGPLDVSGEQPEPPSGELAGEESASAD
jgi:Trypsin-co-occurring domain 2